LLWQEVGLIDGNYQISVQIVKAFFGMVDTHLVISFGDEFVNVDVDNIYYYFDSQAKERIDRGEMGRRSGDIIVLREKLLSMSHADYSAAIKVIEGMVDKHVASAPKPTDQAAVRKDALDLFHQASATESGTAKIAPA
tara:strand:- start:719 stop:1132 length:414 start_codon:yes stop_codon:yes gene_type:complete